MGRERERDGDEDGTGREGDGTENERYRGLRRVGMVWGRGERQGHEEDGDRDRVMDGHAYDGLLDYRVSRFY